MANVQLSSVASTLLPPTITDPIFKKAEETSAIMQLARRVPLSVTANTAIPIPLDVPVAGWVSEAGVKPLATGGVGVKLMTGKKVAMLVPVSSEVVTSNAAGLYDQLVADLPTAIGRAFDHAAIHGKDLATNSAGPFADYLASTPNTQALNIAGTGGTAQNLGGIYTDIVKGVQSVQNIPGMEYTGIAADPRFKTDLMLAVDTQGRPLFTSGLQGFSPATGQAVGSGNVLGYPTFFNAGVSGKLYRENATLGVGTNNVQTLTKTGTTWAAGVHTLTIGGQTTVPIAYNATAAVVQAAVQGLSQLGTDITVTGGGDGTTAVVFTFAGLHGSQVAPTITGTAGAAFTGGATFTVTNTTPGVSHDFGLRAIGGDFSQCAYGVGMDISVKVSNQASYLDGGTWHSAFQENLVLLLVEAYYGFVVGNTNAFVTYTTTAGL
jgi:hypothetical protein